VLWKERPQPTLRAHCGFIIERQKDPLGWATLAQVQTRLKQGAEGDILEVSKPWGNRSVTEQF